jgi:Ca-activated chloride channel homolog
MFPEVMKVRVPTLSIKLLAAFSLALLLQSSLVTSYVLYGGTTPPDSALAVSSPADIHLSPWTSPGKDAGSGALTAMDSNGHELGQCPLQHTAVNAQISGYAARVTVEQVFQNPFSEAIEAVYTFPLSNSSAVDEMKMEIGKRVISGTIQKKDEALRTYLQAKKEGRTSALLEQERTNVFTQSVANIPPHCTVKVLIKYCELLSFQSGNYSFVFPVVVGPRYMPGNAAGHTGSGASSDTTQVPDASKISPPMVGETTRTGHDISLDVSIDAGMPIGEISSKLHKVEISKLNKNTAHVFISREDRIPNRDFVLNWQVGEQAIKSGYLTSRSDEGFFSLMLVPPAKPSASQICPRELNFIIDRSGSQRGAPLEKAKEAVLYMLDHMSAGDTFQVFSFSVGTEQLFARPQPAVGVTIAEAKRYLDAMQADGGTEMRQAVEVATDKPAPNNRLRIITLMTDGYIGNDNEIIELVRRTRGSARWFPFGTGNSVNRNLIDGVATAGGGEADYVLLNSPGAVVGQQFLEKIANPVLTDIKVKFNGVEVSNVEPAIINDVWAQRPIYLTGKYLKPGSGTVEISGFSGGKPFKREMPVDFPAVDAKNTVLPSLWARARVESLSHTTHALQGGKEYEDVRATIEDLGLKYHLLTDFTSFVAVDNSNNLLVPANKSVVVPVESPQGVITGPQQVGSVQPHWTPLLPVGSVQQSFSGTPQFELRGRNSQIGQVGHASDTNKFQVEPTVLDERHYSNPPAERHQKISPTLPPGLPVPDSSISFGQGTRSNPSSDYNSSIGSSQPPIQFGFPFGQFVGQGPSDIAAKVTIISTLDVVDDKNPGKLENDDQKLDKAVADSLASWKVVQDDEPTLKLRLLVDTTNDSFLNQLKGLKVEVLRVSTGEISVNAPVRRVRDITHLKDVIRIELAK